MFLDVVHSVCLLLKNLWINVHEMFGRDSPYDKE